MLKIKITPDIVFVIVLILSIIVHLMYPVAMIVKFPFTMFGVIIIGLGIVLAAISNSTLIRHYTSIKPFKDPTDLITTGVFSMSRNPIYLGMTIFLFGIEICLGSLMVLPFPLIFVIVINSCIIKNEEKRLEKMFGSTYITYKNKVRRWI